MRRLAAPPEYEGLGWLDRLQKYKDLYAKGALPAAIGGFTLYPTAGFPAGYGPSYPAGYQPQSQGTSLNSVPWQEDQPSLYEP
jgi:hypothetical protein